MAHFKSIPISRRRSSVLPLNSTVLVSNHSNNNNGDNGFCSKIKCCLWILLVVGTLIGLVYVWPTVAELEETELAEQLTNSGEQNGLQPGQSINNELDNGEQIVNNLNRLNEELGSKEANNDEESLGTFDYFSSFFGSDDGLTEEQQANEQTTIDNQQEETTTNSDENLNLDNEQQTYATAAAAADGQADEGFDEQANAERDQLNFEEENDQLSNIVPERYQSTVHQDSLDDEEDNDSNDNNCIIGGLIYSNLNEEQCSLLQERQRQLEEQLRQQDQLIKQEQANENEQFYFF